jgi:predicted RNA-binding Zn ribbon-like protein
MTKSRIAGNPFADLSLVGGSLCLDFVNTVDCRTADEPNDRLDAYPALVWWGNRAGVVPTRQVGVLLGLEEERPEAAARVLARGLRLREALFRLLSASADRVEPPQDALEVLNDELEVAVSRRTFTWTGERFRWSWVAGPEPDRLLWPVSLSAAELLEGDELRRLRRCDGRNCDWLFLDRSRNRSRRWCDMAECGNRAKMRRYYRRHRDRG